MNLGSKKAVTCQTIEEARAVEGWRVRNGFDPTPDGQIDMFGKKDVYHLGLEKGWCRYPNPCGLKPHEIITYDKFKELISGAVDFESITNSMRSLLEYKNKKYGNSALEPMQVFSGKTKLGTRLDDKLARIKNGSELKKNDVADCIGYLMLICAENGWDNFDEFKD